VSTKYFDIPLSCDPDAKTLLVMPPGETRRENLPTGAAGSS